MWGEPKRWVPTWFTIGLRLSSLVKYGGTPTRAELTSFWIPLVKKSGPVACGRCPEVGGRYSGCHNKRSGHNGCSVGILEATRDPKSTMGASTEFRRVMHLVFRGVFDPVIQEVMPLSEARRAHEILEKGIFWQTGNSALSKTVDEGLTLREAQRKVDDWISQFDEGYWPPLSNLARLIEEVGELAREMNHLFGNKQKRADEPTQDLAIELADILFVLLAIANEQEIDLEEALGLFGKVLPARLRSLD